MAQVDNSPVSGLVEVDKGLVDRKPYTKAFVLNRELVHQGPV